MSKAGLSRGYWRFLTAAGVSNLGDGISSVAYPWLASAVTRSPILIAMMGFASRLPWLLFTLFAGVISDRFDRKRIIIAMDFFRGVMTVCVAISVGLLSDSLPRLGELTSGQEIQTQWPLYIILLVSALLFGFAEVLRDNTAQTFMPALVDKEGLEKANGRLWNAESIAVNFVGPPLGSFLIGVAVFLPFWVDAATFFISVALVASIGGSFRKIKDPAESAAKEKVNFKRDIKEGFSWLWKHSLFRFLAIVLGLMNFTNTLVEATYILFAQEVLKTSVNQYAILGMAGAIGGLLGGTFGDRVAGKLGRGTALKLTLIYGPIAALGIGLTTSWIVVFIISIGFGFTSVIWNLITVSLRQSTIPAHLLGRVNSVYRFFGWGTIPVGIFLGGLIVRILSDHIGRTSALRSVYFISAALSASILLLALPRLSNERIEAARGEARA